MNSYCTLTHHGYKTLYALCNGMMTFERDEIRWCGNTEQAKVTQTLCKNRSVTIKNELVGLGYTIRMSLIPILTYNECFSLCFGMQHLISIIEHHDEIADS